MIINELLMKKPLITCIIFRLILKELLVEGWIGSVAEVEHEFKEE